ncbi:hypothetical protein Trco_008030 [Trichoderma cornu-damae]|uniref:Uncharacterized protein n=1 Tax=Trichoderma cornu-damae TaxID=654480 RepID=A0A9P8QI31_9HYPO|nr:hypothetical protein Trco_008030 [Trichoderma cornu-damae]
MQFSFLLALLPLALASPIDPRSSQPCCTDCNTTLFMGCMNSCPEHPFFSVCKFDCTMSRVKCVNNCKACDGPKARSDDFSNAVPPPATHPTEQGHQQLHDIVPVA